MSAKISNAGLNGLRILCLREIEWHGNCQLSYISRMQKAYKRYRARKNDPLPRQESTKLMVAEAILKNLHEKVFDEVMSRADIPAEFGNRDDLTEAGKKLQRTFRDRLTRARMTEEGGDFFVAFHKNNIFILENRYP